MTIDLPQYFWQLRKEKDQIDSLRRETTDPELIDVLTYRAYALDREERRVLRELRAREGQAACAS